MYTPRRSGRCAEEVSLIVEQVELIVTYVVEGAIWGSSRRRRQLALTVCVPTASATPVRSCTAGRQRSPTDAEKTGAFSGASSSSIIVLFS